MFFIRKPSTATIQQFLTSQRDLPFSYPEVGATKTGAPAGYNIDHHRVQLGEGEACYQRAVAALRSWKHFEIGWVRIATADTPPSEGTIAVVEAKAFGLWSLNACRVIYLENEDTGLKALFGFAYGTLPDHAERGEERFRVEWQVDDSVWYDIYAFSRPQQRLVQVGFPYVRRLQKRFARDSMAAMVAATR